MTPEAFWWIGFIVFVITLLALDLGVFHPKAHEVKPREALIWTGFGGGLALLLSYFHVAPPYRHRVLFWGILGALIMRAPMIFAGVTLLHAFHWVVYIFSAVLMLGGIKIDPQSNFVPRLVRRILPVAHGDHGPHFFTRENGALAFTPLFVVLLFMEWTDLVFAVDSIPAVLAVTEDSFIVFTSNIMAILGLRSLYFALAGVMERFHAPHYGLAAILIFVGAKMWLADILRIPITVSLAVVAGILVTSVVISLLRPPPQRGTLPEKSHPPLAEESSR